MKILAILLLAVAASLPVPAQEETPAAVKLKELNKRYRDLIFEKRKTRILQHIDSLNDLKEQYLKDGERSDARKVEEAIKDARRDLESIPVFGKTKESRAAAPDETRPVLPPTAPLPASAHVFQAEDAELKSVRYDEQIKLLVDWTKEDSSATWTIPANGMTKGNYDLFLLYVSRVKDFKVRVRIGSRDLRPSLPLTPSRRNAGRGWLGVYRHMSDEEANIVVSTLGAASEEPFRIKGVALVKRP